MAIKKVCKKIILIIITISILLSFTAAPVSNAKLGLKEGEFYYSGTTKGTYVVTEGIFSWLIDNLGKIADWIFGLCTMGVRMVFVGWTALIEKLLTWSVEQAGGVSNNGGLVVDSSDITSVGDSSGNLTVQAIVYNQVPLFDINFFNLEVDKTVSPTGQILRCEKCKKPCEECCNLTKDNVPTGENAKPPCTCDCKDDPCSNCEKYLKNWQAEDPLVLKIREFVAMWYTIIRLLAMVVMLIALLGIGIKMALSTIASEKAVYKRMLVSWVVGMIILFAMHYLMYFIIILNETLVDTVKETASSINKTQIQFINSGEKTKDESGEEVQIVRDDEIEINIYEEIRTRAYDAKLSVGLSGMIMYMTLVYFAIRYSISYLKRYLTIIVLALMAPPLGVSYALQIALTGKGSSLKTWMTEFVMTVIIQIVHALIYAVFISTALALSMESVAGMIVALIFMNFALKAEKMFRQIFKMGESDSLAGSAAEAGDAENVQSKFKAATGLVMSAKPVAGIMMNTPMSKGIKAVGKVGLAGAAATGGLISGAVKSRKSKKDDENPTNNSAPQSGNTNTSGNDNSTEEINLPTMAQEKVDQALMAEGGESLRLKAATATAVLASEASVPEKAAAQQDVDNYMRYQALMYESQGNKKGETMDTLPSSGQIFAAHMKKAVNITNHYQIAAPSKGGAWGNFTQGYHAIFGTKHYDSKTGKMVYDGNGYFSQFNSENLLGLSKKDKEYLKKEAMKPLIGIGGAIGMFGGLMVGVAHPGMGATAFAVGAHKYGQGFKQGAGYKAYKGKYGKAKFPAATMQATQQQLLKQAYSEIDKNQSILDSNMVKNVKDNHADLYNAIKQDLKEGNSYSGIKVGGKVKLRKFGKAMKKGVASASFIPKALGNMTGTFKPAAFTDSMEMAERYELVRAREQTAAFEKESANLIKNIHQQETADLIKQQDDKRRMELFLEGDIDSQRLEEYKAECEKLGYIYNSTSKTLTKKTIKRDDFNKSVSAINATKIENVIDDVISNMYKMSGPLDSTENGIDKTLQLINTRLKNEGIKGKAENLFANADTARRIVESKVKDMNGISQSNIISEEAEQGKRSKLEAILSQDFTKEEQAAIRQVILERGTKNLSATTVMSQVKKKNSGSESATGDRKKKLKSIENFLKLEESITVPQPSAEEASKSAMTKIVSKEKVDLIDNKLKKSHEKIKSVLQFMQEDGDKTIAELMDSTEQKVNGINSGNGDSNFTEVEGETLKLLFAKMKEEVVFNEFTKNVLDQKDSQATKKAKKAMYDKHVDYLSAQRNELYAPDTIASKYSEYGVDSNHVQSMLNGDTVSVENIINSISEENMVKIMKKDKKHIVAYEGEYKDLTVPEKQAVKKSLSKHINDLLSNDVKQINDKLENAQREYQAAQKKAALTGKIDIIKQLSELYPS